MTLEHLTGGRPYELRALNHGFTAVLILKDPAADPLDRLADEQREALGLPPREVAG